MSATVQELLVKDADEQGNPVDKTFTTSEIIALLNQNVSAAD